MYQGQSQLPRRVWSLKPQSNVFLFVYAGLCFVSDGSCFFFLISGRIYNECYMHNNLMVFFFFQFLCNVGNCRSCSLMTLFYVYFS